MKASEAKEKADEFNIEKLYYQYGNIIKSIESQSRTGEYEYLYMDELSEETKSKLIDDGYKITTDRDDYHIITWK